MAVTSGRAGRGRVVRATSNKPKIMLNVTFLIVCAEKEKENRERERESSHEMKEEQRIFIKICSTSFSGSPVK